MTTEARRILEAVSAQSAGLRRLGVRRLGLFGSVVRGEAGPSSDVDFLVEFDRKTFDGYMEVKERLEALCGRRVDLVMADAVKPGLREGILRETVYVTGL